ncbi:GntR family transcriptional regulator [Pseudogemmobacter humi]|uniref:Putative HTH-type transcriptional regulator YdfH n=1 Tax=Pseudogemmobacter humi TaxID=2483812 RepID=A0A3P5XWC7_9RHOB|nr:GntR family transcriptional regulator [Pseudogemmobacter humi]VDC33469.1 putative HTH-type transcriptional regulator YdfH [Pseudogemmobacter humi]
MDQTAPPDEKDSGDLRIAHPVTTLRELAVERLRNAIITGRFSGGDRLVERTLCDQLGVSRSVVREAIRYLEAEGLVEIQPRGGPVVAMLDWPQARQVYEIRRLLESEAAADCASRADDGVKARLRAALADLEAAFDDASPLRLYDATTALYEVIFTAAGHDIAWEVVQRLHSRISRLRALTLATRERRVSGPAHMARICDAICANDPVAAAAAVRDHLRDAAEIARHLLEK